MKRRLPRKLKKRLVKAGSFFYEGSVFTSNPQRLLYAMRQRLRGHGMPEERVLQHTRRLAESLGLE